MSNRRCEDGCERWAREEFGTAQLGNGLRTERAIRTAAGALRRPAGLVTEVFGNAADREGAYRFAENADVSVGELLASCCRASARRAAELPFVFAPVDGSSLSLPEYEGEAERGVGPVGTKQAKGAGVLMMNAIAISPNGTPLGLIGQQWWTRPEQKRSRKRQDRARRSLAEKETRFWFGAINQAVASWEKVNPTTRLWFQEDRGGDFREMLEWAYGTKHLVTVRACFDRRLVEDDRYLWSTVESVEIAGKVEVDLPKTSKRRERRAHLTLRFCPVTLRLKDHWAKMQKEVTLWAVLAREERAPADGSEPIEWLLLTNRPVETLEDAKLVLFGYTQRWRIEQFHKVLKSVCKVEQSQLRKLEHVERWATLLSAVAMRILRLTYLARSAPEAPASEVLSSIEVAALVLKKGKGAHRLGDSISIEQAVRWIAELGGYTGKSSGGPPGSIVLARGLRRLGEAAEALADVVEFTSET